MLFRSNLVHEVRRSTTNLVFNLMGCVNRHRKVPINNNFCAAFYLLFVAFYPFLQFFNSFFNHFNNFFPFLLSETHIEMLISIAQCLLTFP